MTSQSLVKEHWPSRLQVAPPLTKKGHKPPRMLGKPGCLTPRSGGPALWKGPDKDDRTAHGSAGQSCSFRESKVDAVSYLTETQNGRLLRPDVRQFRCNHMIDIGNIFNASRRVPLGW